ncbi:MAG TPA: hypothetical protein DGT21_08105 [Armatimonadetes bacterium]|jgi:hypothetical protein|nr:hypothetical protein [Armatimonadota bacterium]
MGTDADRNTSGVELWKLEEDLYEQHPEIKQALELFELSFAEYVQAVDAETPTQVCWATDTRGC